MAFIICSGVTTATRRWAVASRHQSSLNLYRRFLSTTSTSKATTGTTEEASDASDASDASAASNKAPPPLCDVVQGPNLLRTPVARPNPSLMLLPGLRSLPFWTSSSADPTSGGRVIAYGDPIVTRVVDHLEHHVDAIRDEYKRVAATKPRSDYEATDMGTQLHRGTWEWHSYMTKGSVQGSFCHDFPATAKILQALRGDPGDHVLFEGTPFGFSFLSTLHANSSIQAHTSAMNLRLRVHLPLIVPTTTTNDKDNNDTIDCGIRVGNLQRPWTNGKAMVFDDSYDHEVWNRTEETRVLLLVDIWHPDISNAEKQEIVKVFQDARQQGLWKR
jgi:hypothetical protein